MKKWLIMLLAVVLALGGLFTGAAAEEERDMFTLSPFVEVKGKLKPLNISSEDQGIRVTVDSALVRDDNLWISYKLEDLEDSRIDEFLFANCSYHWIDYHVERDDISYSAGGFGETTNHGAMIQYLKAGQLKDMDTLSVSMHHFPVARKYRIPLLPLLEKYGKEKADSTKSSSIHAHEWRSMLSSGIVLDPAQSLDVPLSDDPETKSILLSGIGWIDSRLHVQVHFTENERLGTDDLMTLDRWEAQIRYFNGDIGDYSKTGYVNSHFMWDDEGIRAMKWADFTVGCKPEEADKLEKYFIELTCVQDVLEGNWELSVPLDQVRAEQEEQTKGTIYDYDFSEPLVEINHSSESQGIRITAVAGRMTDDEVMIVYDLQDLEGHRLDSELAWVTPGLAKYNLSVNKEGMMHIGEREFDSSRNHGKVQYGFHYDKLDSDDTLTITLDSLPVFENKSIAILPLVEKYGGEAEGCYVRKYRSWSASGTGAPEKNMVLDFTHPLDIPLDEDPEMKDILLGGIGWVDGRLHILIHYIDHDQKGAKLGESAYNVWSCNLVDQAAHVSVGERVLWDEDGDAVRDYVDFVINCKPDDPKLGDYSLNLEYIREFVDGNWEINIPLEEIR